MQFHFSFIAQEILQIEMHTAPIHLAANNVNFSA